MITTNIPVNKLQESKFKDFLEKYIGVKIKDSSYYRKYLLDELYGELQTQIKKKHLLLPIFIMFDETTDACRRFILNILIGECSESKRCPPILYKTVELSRTNSDNINI